MAGHKFDDAVRGVLRKLPAGSVVTYGEVAVEAGYAGAARAVGTLLSRSAGDLPWWRVVTSTGRLVPGKEREHARLLRSEGVRVLRGRVSPVVISDSRTLSSDRLRPATAQLKVPRKYLVSHELPDTILSLEGDS
ncbi:MAG TPA: MGMT family protein [Acidimicrobiales bacterium]